MVILEDRPENAPSICGERWYLLAIIGACFFAYMYISTGFVIVNDVVAEYFDRSAEETDLLGTLGCLTAFVACFLVLCIGQKASLRCISIVAGTCLFIGSSCATIGFLGKRTYWMVILGVASSGISFGLLLLLPLLLFNKLFDAMYSPVIFSIPFGCLYVGGIISESAFQYLIRNCTMCYESDPGFWTAESIRQAFVRGFGVISLLAFGAAVLLCLNTRLKSKGNEENDDKDDASSEEQESTDSKYYIEWLRDDMRDICRRDFVLICLANFMGTPIQIYTLLRVPGMLWKNFPNVGVSVITYTHILTMISGFAGSVTVAIVLLRFRALKEIALLASSAAAVSCAGIYLGYILKIYAVLIPFQIIISFSWMFCMITLLEILSTLEGNANKITSVAFYFAIYNAGLFGFDLWERYCAINYYGQNFFELSMLVTGLCTPVLLSLLGSGCCNKGPTASNLLAGETHVATERSRLINRSKTTD
ncbi:uncharacterized protein LOC120339394 [Styela clava]